AENQAQMEQLQQEGWNVIAIPIPETWPITSYAAQNQEIGYAFLPHQVEGEGFYLAVLQKPDDTPARWPKSKQKPQFESNSPFRSRWITLRKEDALLTHYEHGYWIPTPLAPVIPLLQHYTGLIQ